MENILEITVNYSTRRPEGYSWQAVFGIHSAYGKTEEEAVTRLREILEVYSNMERILRGNKNFSDNY